jgi:hypothetical protein
MRFCGLQDKMKSSLKTWHVHKTNDTLSQQAKKLTPGSARVVAECLHAATATNATRADLSTGAAMNAKMT